jgi:hypothetical protein
MTGTDRVERVEKQGILARESLGLDFGTNCDQSSHQIVFSYLYEILSRICDVASMFVNYCS